MDPFSFYKKCAVSKKFSILECWRVADFESLVKALDGVHYIIILLLRSWCKP
jgi:hypothetical protein